MTWRKLKSVEYIVVHGSATKPEMDIGVEEITRWHKMKGWLTVGYHYVIRRDGVLEEGRSRTIPGAHSKGYNHKSLGICVVGGLDSKGIPNGAYTEEQYATLKALLTSLTLTHSKATVVGHRDLDNASTACPCIDIIPWWAENKDKE